MSGHHRPFGLYPDQCDAVFLRWGLRDTARTHALRVWHGFPEWQELSLLHAVAQSRCDAAGYMCDSKRIAAEEFASALAVVDEHMEAAARAAREAVAQALQRGADRRRAVEAAIEAVRGFDPLPPEAVVVAAVEKAFSRHRWQLRAWRQHEGAPA